MLPDGSINPGDMTSFNHYALGSVASWMHEVIGGISPLQPGWRHILVKPQPGGSITHASVQHLSPYGMISCKWEIVDGVEIDVELQIPPNCTARIELPGWTAEKTLHVGSGMHRYREAYQPHSEWPPKALQMPFGPPKKDVPV
jgi:alpha-L-rhamnosidase